MGESESCEAPFTSDVSEGVGSKSFLRSPRCAPRPRCARSVTPSSSGSNSASPGVARVHLGSPPCERFPSPDEREPCWVPVWWSGGRTWLVCGAPGAASELGAEPGDSGVTEALHGQR
jgi:hypothetical protein